MKSDFNTPRTYAEEGGWERKECVQEKTIAIRTAVGVLVFLRYNNNNNIIDTKWEQSRSSSGGEGHGIEHMFGVDPTFYIVARKQLRRNCLRQWWQQFCAAHETPKRFALRNLWLATLSEGGWFRYLMHSTRLVFRYSTTFYYEVLSLTDPHRASLHGCFTKPSL